MIRGMQTAQLESSRTLKNKQNTLENKQNTHSKTNRMHMEKRPARTLLG